MILSTEKKTKILLIIGLPGSGKTNLIKKIKTIIDDVIVYDDWGKWTINGLDRTKFQSDVNIEKLNEDINKKNTIIISCVGFCNSNYLVEAKEYLTTISENIEISHVFFENNVQKCVDNVIKRDMLDGAYFEEVENGYIYVGDHTFNYETNENERKFENEINKIKKISKIYTVPDNHVPLEIKTENIKISSMYERFK